MLTAIHQPNFLPWLGFFHKLSQVNTFIIFDNVPAAQGKSWLTRNQINLNGSPTWLTVPTRKKGREGQLIRDLEIDYKQPWIRKHLGTLAQAYRQSPFYQVLFPQIQELYHQEHKFLTDFNVALIQRIAHLLGFDCRYCRASEMASANKRKTEMIIHVCLSFNCSNYLTGLGCLTFLEPNLFHANRINLLYQKFKHPIYDHLSRVFLPNMSAVDAIFCLGPDRVREMLRAQIDFYKSIDEVRQIHA